MPAGRPLKFKDKKTLQKKIDAYFTKCDKGKKVEVYDKKSQGIFKITKQIPYTITGLALALDTTRHTLIHYEGRKEFIHTIKKAKLRCENYAELLALSGDVPPAGPIFILKNYEWSDKQEIEVTDKTVRTIKKKFDGSEDV